MILIDCVQGTKEWLDLRMGIPTSSCFDKIITTKGEPSKQAEKYMWQLAGERVSGFREESFQSEAMKRGNIIEQEAREFYELTHDVKVRQIGFCLSDCKKYGASPDGFIGEEGGIQIKCPLVSTHVSYLLDGEVPTEYFTQNQGELLVTGRKYIDFTSYFPGIRPLVVRVKRDEVFISKLKKELEMFCENLEKIVEKIK